MDVGDWLRNLGLERHEPAFRRHHIDSNALPNLTAQHLKDLGVESAGDCRKLLEAIRSLPEPLSAIMSPGTQAERRQLTVMFCDLVDSTALASRLDPEDLREILRAYHGWATRVVERSGGFVAKFMGDGVLAYFGYPLAHENHAERAVRAGLALAETVSELRTVLQQPLQVRVGIATGLVVVGDLTGEGLARESAVIGQTPNLASRLLDFAAAGHVVIAADTRRLTGGLFAYRDLGALVLKGFAQPIQAWQVLRSTELDSRFEASREIESAPHSVRPDTPARAAEAPFETTPRKGLTPYVGRVAEIYMLERALSEASGHTRVVDITGEPGIGKSRLVYEFRRRLAGKDVVVLSGSSWPDSELTAFRPFIEVARRSFGLTAADTQAEAAQKLDAGLACLALAGNENLALLMNLLGMRPPTDTLEGLDGVLIGLRTRDLLLQVLRARCQTKQVVMLLEDLHWLDRASEDLLFRIITKESDLPLLIVATFRPEYGSPWSGQPGVTRLRLAPLPAKETAQIVQMRLGLSVIDTSLAQLVTDRAEGNPLFAEEIANFIADQSTLRLGTAAPEYDVEAVATALPASVQSLLSARVDGLAPRDRALLQVASVIGRCFDPELLAVVSGSAKDVHGRLRVLEALDLVHVTPASGEYLFKHALLRDVLYGSLLTGPRTALHLKTAEETERRSANRLIEVAEVLAHHYSRANQPAKAVEYLAMAGSKSLRIYSLDEAERFTRSALALARAHDERRMDVQVAGIMADLVQILILKSAAREVAALLEPELATIEALGESEHAPILMYYYGYALVVMCRFREARPIQDKALALALERGSVRATAYARSGIILQTTYVDPMPLDAFEAFATRAFAESEQANDAYLIGHMMFVIAWNYMHRGLVVEAENWGHRLEKLGHERQDPRSSALALWLLGWIDIIRENYAAAASRGQESARTALTPFDHMMGTHVVGIAKIMSGEVAEGVETVQGHRELALKNGLAVGALGTEATLGVAMAMRGDLAKSVRWMEALIERCERDYGYQAYADFTRTYLAEIYLALLKAETRPPLRVLLGNLRFLLTVKRTAPKKAMELLNTALRNQQFHEGGVLRSRIEFNAGLLQQRLNQHGLARDHLMRARAGASAQHATALLGKIDAALQSM